MPTIKDCVLLELALRKGSVPAEKLEQGKTAQKELERFGISKSLGAILVEKNLAAREAVAEIAEEMSSCSIRCPSCGRPNAVSDADRNGNLKCKHCQEAVTCAEGRISDDDLSVSLKSGGRNRREPKGGKAKEARTGQAMSAGTVQAAAAMDSSYIESVTLDDLAPRREVSKFRLEQLAGVSPAGKLYRTMNGPNPAALKVFDRDIDKQNLIGPFADALTIAQQVAAEQPHFGLLADLSHFPLLREKPEEAIPLVKGYLRHAHIGNCIMRDRKHPAYGDLQPRFGITGGEIDTEDVAHYFDVLWNNGFFHQQEMPVISAEVRPLLAGEREEVILANAKRVIREAWALFQRRRSL